MVDDLIGWLNDNSGAVLGIATVAYTVVTLALAFATVQLVREASRAREAARVAEVDITLQPWDEAHMYLAVTIASYGPANARDLDFHIVLRDKDGSPLDEWRLQEGLFPVGRHRTTLLKDAEIDQMAAAGRSVDLTWSWTDGSGQRHLEKQARTVADVARGYRGSGALLQRDYLREVPKIRATLEKTQVSLAEIAARLRDPRP